MDFQDEIHLSVISEALWEGKDSGRAAVLIGAGFSRNAEPARINSQKFPLWGDVANAIVEHLYSDPDSREFKKAQEQARSTSGALRLADEFVAAHGRSKLDDLLIQTIRDEDFRPGEIHRRVMELPWRDVFTTNYDTLLERTAIDVFGRKYGLISNIAEIPTARSPRIVKLHGSMPSQRPFILSEEDFRTYPRKFAPFVNLTQQSMMENIFCLFGFSGDDPNFLAWSGWVRDELAEWAPRLYLCGLLDLNDAKRRLLHNRNVTPIDLSPLFPRSDYPDPDVRHRKAIEHLLDYLEAARPPHPLRWHERRPKVRPGNFGKTPTPAAPEGAAESQPEAVPYLNHESIRGSYPGWIIAPASVRDSITGAPLSWRLEELKKLADRDPLTRLEALDNLNWWLDISLQPLWNPIADEVVRALRDVNPFPTILKDWSATIACNAETISLSKQQDRWLSLSLSYLRYLREERRFPEFEEWSKRLEDLTADSPQYRQRLYFERGLSALGNADDEQLEAILSQWEPHDCDPIWAIRRAALQTELGYVDEAHTVVSQALVTLRRSAKGKRDILSQSREGWCMKLLYLLNHGKKEFDDEMYSRFRERWEELNEFRCNPWIDWDYFEAVLDRPSPEFPTETKQVGFAPGAIGVTRHWGTGNIEKLLPAYQLFRLIDEAAAPTAAGSWTSSKKLLVNAAEWFIKHDPVRVPSILCRTLDDDLLKKYFTRYRVAALPQAEINEWRDRCRRILNAAIPRMLRVEKYHMDAISDRAHSQLILSLKVLTRIALRMPLEQLSEIFNETFQLWGTEPTRRSHQFNESLSELLAVVARQMPRPERAKAILDLVTLPVAGVSGRFNLDQVYHDITADIPTERGLISRRSSPERLKALVQSLLSLSKTASKESGAHGRVLRRLYWLYDNGLLTRPEERAFGKVLWSNVTSDSEVPSIRGLNRMACLWCPEPKPGKAAAHLKAFILQKPIPKFSDGIELGDNRLTTLWAATAEYSGQRTTSGCGRVEWTPSELTQIHDSVFEWWNGEGKGQFGKQSHPWHGEVIDGRLKNVLSTLIRVLIPRTNPKSQSASQIVEMVSGIEALDFPNEIVLPALLRLVPDRENEFVERLSQALVSNDEKRLRSSIDGIFFWIQEDIAAKKKQSYYRLPNPPARLLNELAILAAHRRQPGLLLVLDAIRWAIKVFPNLLTAEFIARTTTALGSLRVETTFDSSPSETQFSLEELPSYRVYAARIAVQLHNHSKGRSKVTEDWMNDIQNDPLPEVRKCLEPESEADTE